MTAAQAVQALQEGSDRMRAGDYGGARESFLQASQALLESGDPAYGPMLERIERLVDQAAELEETYHA